MVILCKVIIPSPPLYGSLASLCFIEVRFLFLSYWNLVACCVIGAYKKKFRKKEVVCVPIEGISAANPRFVPLQDSHP